MAICRKHCQTSNQKALMKNSKNYVMTPTATLTQSGLLAVLLQRQRYKVIELARRRAHREQARAAFRSTLNWLLTLGHGGIAGRTFRRGFGGSVPHHTQTLS
jgi:hypothetical protein